MKESWKFPARGAPPATRSRVPLWFAARGHARRPVRRAARYDGLFPIEVDIDGLRSMLDVVRAERGSLSGFDVAVHAGLADDDGVDRTADLEEIGVTWLIHSASTHATVADIEILVDTGIEGRGPASSAP